MIINRWDCLYLLYPCFWIVVQYFLTFPENWQKTLRATYCIFTGTLATIVAVSGLYTTLQCSYDRIFCTTSVSEFHLHSVLNFMLVTTVYYLQFKGKSQFLVHHFLIALGWYKALTSGNFHFYCGMAMVSEFTNTFLSLDFWYFVMEKDPDALYRTNLNLLKVSYGLFRLILYPILGALLIHDCIYTELEYNKMAAATGMFLGLPIWVLSVFWFFNGVLKKSEQDLLKKN